MELFDERGEIKELARRKVEIEVILGLMREQGCEQLNRMRRIGWTAKLVTELDGEKYYTVALDHGFENGLLSKPRAYRRIQFIDVLKMC